MGNQFYKGRTNNHLTWVMVDATDFATPESALSAATKIKIYGKLRGQAAHNFVSSGTGSLTNDIQHIGASALGIYTIALVKADLSDASAAWYDQYIISLSATGAAYQTLVVDGGIDLSAVSGFQSRLSDIASALLVTQSMASDAASAATQANSRVLVTQSAASDAASAAAQANSRVLLVQSRLSDFDSRVVSDVSDILSQLTVIQSMASDAASAATQANSRVLLNQSRISDIASYLVVMSGVQSDIYSALSDAHSDLKSAIGGITAAVSASDISDIASAVRAAIVSDLSDILSAAVQTNSRVLLVQSRLSDFDSRLVSDISDLKSQLSDAHSDLKSAIGGITVTLDASNISDIASAVVAALPITSLVSDAHSAAAQANSRILVVQSRLSDLDSRLVSDVSDLASQMTVVQSMASDAASAAQQGNSRVLLVQSRLSDLDSRLVSDLSDVLSQLTVVQSMASDAHSAANVGNSRVLLVQSRLSDLDSRLVSDLSDVQSQLTVVQSMASDAHSAAVQANSRVLVTQSMTSDIYSQVLAGVPVGASAMSDIASQVWAFGTRTLTSSGAIKKNTELQNFEFFMVSSTDHVSGKTGLTVTATRSLDGAAFAACANSASEVSGGVYKITLAAADVNADVVSLKFSGTGADDTIITFKTTP